MVDLATAASLSVSTIKRVEDGMTSPALDVARSLLRDALESEGVEFLPDDGTGAGVRLGHRSVA